MNKNKDNTTHNNINIKTAYATSRQKISQRSSSHHPTRNSRRVTNWRTYNQALVSRGNISVYVSEAIAKNVFSKPSRRKNHQGGHPVEYQDDLILFMLTIRELLHLPLRQTIGFVTGLLLSMKLSLSWHLPDYSTLSRRMAKLKVDFCRNFHGQNIVLLLDSSGFKVFGEGEWKVRKHGLGYRRTWRETHIAVDLRSRNIIGVINTKPSIGDSTQLKPLLKQVQARRHQITTVIGDGAYDAKANYTMTQDLGLEFIVPPPKNATEHINMYHYHIYDKPGWEKRNAVVRRIEEVGATKWKQETGYHRRSLVENSFMRLKTIFGGNLKSRTEQAQYTEQCIRAKLINQFNQMGLPEYAS
jgi:hypothetical protein